MKPGFRTTCLIVLLSAACKPTAAQDMLDIGDKAPPLAIMEWVKGKPVDLERDAKKRIHVVEFWATWCAPCKMSVPLLTELQQKHRDKVTIVGVTEPDMRGNSPQAIRDFVKEYGEKMDYTVGIDSGATTRTYLAAAGAIGIPHAFVIDHDRRIVWQGSPLDPALGDVLAQLTSGSYDIEQAKVEQKVNKKLEELNFLAQVGQWNTVWDGLLEILKMDPANEVAMNVLQDIALHELGRGDEYRRWVRQHLDAHKGNAAAMRRLADTLSRISDYTLRMPDLTLEAARAARDAGAGKDAWALMVYARALYQIGDLDRAIAMQQDAVALANGTDREQMKNILQYYRRCKELREAVN